MNIYKQFSQDDKVIEALDYAVFKELNKLCGLNSLKLIKIASADTNNTNTGDVKYVLEGSLNFENVKINDIVYFDIPSREITIPCKIYNITSNQVEVIPQKYNEDTLTYEYASYETIKAEDIFIDTTIFGRPYNNTPFLQYFYTNIFSEFAKDKFLDNIGYIYSTLRYMFKNKWYRRIIQNYAFVDKSIFAYIDRFFDYYLYINRKHTKFTDPPIIKNIPILWVSADLYLEPSKYEEFFNIWDVYGSWVFDPTLDSGYVNNTSHRFKYIFDSNTNLQYLNTRFDSNNNKYVWNVLLTPDDVFTNPGIFLTLINNTTEINEDNIQKTVYRNLFKIGSGFVAIKTYNGDKYPIVQNVQVVRITENNTQKLKITYTFTPSVNPLLPEHLGYKFDIYYLDVNNNWVLIITEELNDPQGYMYIYTIPTSPTDYTNYTLGVRVYAYSSTIEGHKGIVHEEVNNA